MGRIWQERSDTDSTVCAITFEGKFVEEGKPTGSVCDQTGKLFFSSSMADVALWLGPYMSISSKNVICTRTEKVRNAGKSRQKNQYTDQPDDPQIPQPDLRFVKRNSKPDTQKGQEPKQKHPQKRFAKGHSGLTTVSYSKTCIK